jgi:hypothetical protein
MKWISVLISFAFMRVFLILSFLPSLALAQPSAHETARREFGLGQEAYSAGRCREAAEHFVQAYRREQLADLIFNQAQAWRCDYQATHDLTSARTALGLYQHYLEAPTTTATDRGEAIAQISELSKQLAGNSAPSRSSPTPAPAASKSAPAAALVLAAPAPAQPRRKRTGLWIGLGVGAALVAGGLAVGLGVGLSANQNGGAPTVVPRW